MALNGHPSWVVLQPRDCSLMFATGRLLAGWAGVGYNCYTGCTLHAGIGCLLPYSVDKRGPNRKREEDPAGHPNSKHRQVWLGM